jgi:hypothetical protein
MKGYAIFTVSLNSISVILNEINKDKTKEKENLFVLNKLMNKK